MTNLVTSVIRTWTPIIVGAIVTFLASRGLELDAEFSTNLLLVLQALFTGVYYLIVRLLEKKWPQLGVLLGVATKPKY